MKGESKADDVDFLREAPDSLATRRCLVPALWLAAFIAAGRIFVLSNLPTRQDPDPLYRDAIGLGSSVQRRRPRLLPLPFASRRGAGPGSVDRETLQLPTLSARFVVLIE